VFSKTQRVSFLLFLSFSCVQFTILSQSALQLKNQRAAINKEIETTNAILIQTKKAKKATVEEFQLVEKQIAERETLLNNINSGLKLVQEDINLNNREMDSLHQQLVHVKAQYKKIARKRYIQKLQQSNWIDILSANGLREAMLRMQFQQQLESYFYSKKRYY